MIKRGLWLALALLVAVSSFIWQPAVADDDSAAPQGVTEDVSPQAPGSLETQEAPALTDAIPPPETRVPSLCFRSYCADEGLRCAFSGTGPRGCCRYNDCFLDPTCVGPDPLPPNAC